MASLLRTKRNSSDRAVLDQGNPPFRRTVGEMSHVDVAAHARNAPKRHGAKRAKPAQDGLVQGKLLTRLRGNFGGHAIVIRFAAAHGLDVLAQLSSLPASGAVRRDSGCSGWPSAAAASTV